MIPSLAKGGAERVVSILSREFSKIHDIDILVKSKKLGITYNYHGNLFDLEQSTSENLLFRIYGFILNCVKVNKIKNKNNYDISISFLEEMNVINILTSKKIKTLLCIRSYLSILFQEKSFVNLIYHLFIKWFYNKSDYLITQTELGKYDLITNFNISPEKLFVIPNAFDIENIKRYSIIPLKKEFDIDSNAPIIANIGQLYHYKCQWPLIKIFSRIKEEINEAKLFIIGDGELKEKLVSLTKTIGLKVFLFGTEQCDPDADVYFLGQQDNPFSLISKSNLYIHTSLLEGFPNVIVEAMTCGIPIISSDCKAGPREILAPDTDFKIQTKKPEFSQYGILMPIFDGKKIYNTDLNKIEMIWKTTIINILKDKKMMNHYSNKSKIRSKDYEIKSIAKEWYDIFNKFD